jgi:DNA-binding transcriptional ArsR family regulator
MASSRQRSTKATTRQARVKVPKAAVPSLADRVSQLEAAFAALTAKQDSVVAQNDAGTSPAQSTLPPRKFWVIDGALRNAELQGNSTGGVVFGGQVELPMGESYAWQIEADTDKLLAADWSVAHAALAALAHPMRLTILRALLHGERNTQSLQALPNMGTTGQLYHHLKELETAGWIRQPRRGEYQVLAERVVPLLTIVSTCEITQN